jgi:hypothetical protein
MARLAIYGRRINSTADFQLLALTGIVLLVLASLSFTATALAPAAGTINVTGENLFYDFLTNPSASAAVASTGERVTAEDVMIDQLVEFGSPGNP